MPSSLVGFAIVAGLLTLVPGLDTALILRTAVLQGRRAAFAAASGVSFGVLCWAFAAAVGLSQLLTASQLAYDAVRFAGAAYLVFLGSQLLWKSGAHATTTAPQPPSGASRSAFVRGWLTNLLNPKVGVFYVAILPGFIPAQTPTVPAGLALGLVHVVETMLWSSLLIYGTRLLGSRLTRPAVRVWIERITGVTLIGLGARVALTAR